jgi:hypothetical protein
VTPDGSLAGVLSASHLVSRPAAAICGDANTADSATPAASAEGVVDEVARGQTHSREHSACRNKQAEHDERRPVH